MTDFRDVTPKEELKGKSAFLQIPQYLFRYIKNPTENIKSLPDWPWSHLIVTTLALAASSGVIAGVLSQNFFAILGGLFIAPLIGLVISFLLTLVFYYYFQIAEKRTHSLRKLFTLVLLANIPFFIFQTGSAIIPPITLVGFGFTSLLLAVGLTENFGLDKKTSVRLVAILFAVVFFMWIISRWENSQFEKL